MLGPVERHVHQALPVVGVCGGLGIERGGQHAAVVDELEGHQTGTQDEHRSCDRNDLPEGLPRPALERVGAQQPRHCDSHGSEENAVRSGETRKRKQNPAQHSAAQAMRGRQAGHSSEGQRRKHRGLEAACSPGVQIVLGEPKASPQGQPEASRRSFTIRPPRQRHRDDDISDGSQRHRGETRFQPGGHQPRQHERKQGIGDAFDPFPRIEHQPLPLNQVLRVSVRDESVVAGPGQVNHAPNGVGCQQSQHHQPNGAARAAARSVIPRRFAARDLLACGSRATRGSAGCRPPAPTLTLHVSVPIY